MSSPASPSPSSSSSFLLRITPERTFDIHVLRTFTRDLNGWIVRLQSTSSTASETINQIIYALNHTFREVELSYRVWRNERIQIVLQHGFQYARGRIQAALWRRERGRPISTFPAIYPAFQFSGVINPSPERQPRALPPTQGEASFYPSNTYAPAAPSSAPWPTSPQPQAAQLFPTQSTYAPRNEPATQPPQVGSVAGLTPGFGQTSPNVEYPPPPYPPANWRPPDPVPGSPPVTAAAAATVEVAIRYLEAVNKAIGVCIDFDFM